MSAVTIVCYDITNDKLRTQFSRFLEKYGVRLQYSVFEIKSSKRVLTLIRLRIETFFEKRFAETDSIYIFSADYEKAIKYGTAIHRDQDFLYLE